MGIGFLPLVRRRTTDGCRLYNALPTSFSLRGSSHESASFRSYLSNNCLGESSPKTALGIVSNSNRWLEDLRSWWSLIAGSKISCRNLSSTLAKGPAPSSQGEKKWPRSLHIFLETFSRCAPFSRSAVNAVSVSDLHRSILSCPGPPLLDC